MTEDEFRAELQRRQLIMKQQALSEKKGLGRRIWENIVGDNDPTTQNFGEKAGTMLNMAGEAMTAGIIGDEASAAVAAAIPGGMGYDDRLAYERDQQRIAENDNPYLATAAKIGGAMMLPIGGGLNVARAAGIGAAAGGTYGFAEGEGGIGNRGASGVVGAAAGAAGGAAAVPLGKVINWATSKGGKALGRLMSDRRIFADGKITDEGRATLRALGYNIDELSESFTNTFQKNLDDAMAPQSAAAATELSEFGIPAFRPNVTGSLDDFAAMERARRGGAGDAIRERVMPALDAQDRAMRQAADDIATGLSGGVRADQADAASTAMTATRAARDASRNAARQAYDALEASGSGIKGSAVQNFGARIGQDLRMMNLRVDPGATPNAAAALQTLDDVFSRAENGAVPFMDIERARQQLVRFRSAAARGALGQDQVAMDNIVKAFDDRLDGLMTTAMTEGDSAVIESAKNARALWREYSQKFTGDGAASRFIQDMIDEDASPDQVVRWLFSSGKLGTGRFNSTIAKGVKETLGETSEAWNLIRQAAFRQMFERPEGVAQWGPQKISSNIAEFLRSPSTRDLSRVLFSKDEIGTMLRYSSALNRLVPPPGAVNYSGTAYEGARMARSAFQALAGTLGLGGGGPIGAGAGIMAARGVQSGQDWLVARSLLSARPLNVVSSRAATAGGVTAGQIGPAATSTMEKFLTQPQ